LTLAALLIGMTLVIGSACVFNNYLDRDIDSKMPRTKSRALVTQAIPNTHAITFGIILGIVGFLILLFGTNLLTALLGLAGIVSYVGMYTPAKHRTEYATLIGTIPGAIPPAAGYTAAKGSLDIAALLLFIILVCWQMPHFYGIAIRRREEYAAANVPVWPVVRGLASTRVQMQLYAIGFLISAAVFTLLGYTGIVFIVVLGLAGIYWLYLCFQKPPQGGESAWAKHVFLYSLLLLPLMSVLFVLERWLP
jgi:protoheme IX farnesyltransferase